MSPTETHANTLDFHPVLGLRCVVTAPAEETGGSYVEMDCTADPGFETMIHRHPGAEESYEVTAGALEVLFGGEWRRVSAGESFAVPRGEVHAFRNRGEEPARFVNRHSPALGFQAHLETMHRLIRSGKVRGLNDPRSLVYMCMSAVKHRPDVAVKPPQWVVNALAGVGKLLHLRLD